MSHDQSDDQGFEKRDLSAGGLYGFFVGLIVCTAIVFAIMLGVYRFMDSYEKSHEPPMNPMAKAEQDTRETDAPAVAKQMEKTFPQPRLETDERTEIRDFRLKEEQQLHSYGWMDQSAGAVHIPIDQAMQLIVERGLPTTPKTGTVPASTVSVINDAVDKSDHSEMPASKK
ncbi:MAG TPA: hypothetical protein VGP65_04625 [Candidatus Angelobacter sp.]|jgi:hypothetical protein|nr:hypothetical protein [Candidatus Angelobacter sp.]